MEDDEHPPNVEVDFDESDGRARFIAARDIAVGEEACVSYAYDIEDDDKRSEYLYFNYGFREEPRRLG